MLKFKKGNVTDILDKEALGEFLFVREEDVVLDYDNELGEYTGEILKRRAEFLVGTKNNRRATRVTFPPEADLSGFGFREPVELIEPKFNYVYIGGSEDNGFRRFFDLVIKAEGVRKKMNHSASKMLPKKEGQKQQD